ncbi:prion-like-(Q/N-rich) domain-bearing protein 25 [Dendroctonus ponderosae]|uniref:EGF-like domain-containing protein n=1 Tax=Dendroctonus ponderosae TaxID=77166 RepID=U4U8L5_DENPD|nr:prion-like-(Q/N-rich) domain-bearing protein 25 [Dendroctonus ponderosae]ERL90264.1 hypothetical protein D910_07616 [Dendroctonus ponderosae]KAH1018642.1 hypothetical protein HUJ05_006371 [Dendroctonus ponderosae]
MWKLIALIFLFAAVSEFCVALNENCVNNSDCVPQEKSVCKNEICTCDSLWYYLDEQGKCVKYATEYGDICYESKQCADFLGHHAQCVNNVCSCESGFRWYKGQCVKYAKKNEPCDSTDTICMDLDNPLALTCGNSSICECSDGFYDRADGCRLKAVVNETCAIFNDCFPKTSLFEDKTITSHCELGVCVADPGQVITELNNTKNNVDLVLDQLQSEDFDIFDDVCLEGNLTAFTEEQCNNCPKTLFFKNSECICRQGFFLHEGKCIAELGMPDITRTNFNVSDCPIRPGSYSNGACYCRSYWFQDGTNRECTKTTLQYTDNCMTNEWCKAMGNYAYCDSATQKCVCSSQAVFNETSFYCNLKEDADWTGLCLSDSECALYETCVDEHCQCTEGFYRPSEESLCLPKIGSSCEVRNCSHINHAECSEDDECRCESLDYATDGLRCEKYSTALYEECVFKEQCSNLPHASCLLDDSAPENSTSRCLCADDYVDKEQTCYLRKYPGSLCTTKMDCTIILGDSFECRNMLCQCPIGSSLNQDVCVKSAAASSSLNIHTLALVGLFVLLRH